jgi:cysteine desulfurase/selenocysteine lyase
VSAVAREIPTFDVARLRQDFPCLSQDVHGKPLVYLDNAASAQVPRAVVDAVDAFYLRDRANVHRGVHALSQRSTEAYEAVRHKVARFLGAADEREITYVRGTTEAINLVAQTFGRSRLGPGDEVLVSWMEHHSNIVPWQLVAQATGARVRAVPIDDRGQLDMAAFESMLTDKVKLVAMVHVSNALGTINPVERIIELAHARGIPVLLDGAQAAPHGGVDVAALDVDFYAFSGHKLFGPSGIGALYGKLAHLEAMPPYHGGGDMIRKVSFEGTTYADPPFKFEAGTPNVPGALGLGAAIDYLGGVDMAAAAAHEHALLEHATEAVSALGGVRLIGTAEHKEAVLSFVLDDVHASDVGTLLDLEGVAVRTGHHCAQPVMERFGVPATVRASFAFYNTHDDVEALVRGLHKVVSVFR